MAIDPNDIVDASLEPRLPTGEVPPTGSIVLITYPITSEGVTPPTYGVDLDRFRSLLTPAQAAPASLPVVSLALSAAAAPVGTAVTLTATATSAAATIAKVEFFDNGQKVGQATAQPWQYTYTGQVAGRHTLVAVATDSAGAATTSAVQYLDLSAAVLPVITVTLAPVSDGTVGQALSLLASASVSAGAIAKVEFFDGATKVGESGSSPYATSYVPGAAGKHYLTAKATSATGQSAVSAQQVVAIAKVFITDNAKPTVSLSLTSGTIALGDTATLTALAADTDGVVTKVEFFDGATKLDTLTAPPYATVFTPLTSGNHALSAVATDNGGASATAALVLSVSPTPNTTPNPPELSPDDTNNTLLIASTLGASEIEVDVNNSGAYVAYTAVPGYDAGTGKIVVGDVNRAAGYYKARIKAAAGRNPSAPASSTAFHATVVAPTFNTTVNSASPTADVVTFAGLDGVDFKFNSPLPTGDPGPFTMSIFLSGTQLAQVDATPACAGQACAVAYNGTTYQTTFQNGTVNL